MLRKAQSRRVVWSAVVVAAFVFTAGAGAARTATAPKASPLDSAQPQAVCGAPRPTTPGRGPSAHCDAYALAGTNGRLMHVSAAVMPHRGSKVSPNVNASPNIVESMYPNDLNTAYALPFTTAGSASRVIAIVDAFDNPNVKSDLDAYDAFWRARGLTLPDLPTCATPSSSSCFMKVNQSGLAGPLPTLDTGWALEISLDVDTVHALCQNCKIILVEASSASLDDLGAAENEAVALGATIITNSYGAPEGTTSDFVQSADFATFAPDYRHSGVLILASTGDDAFAGGTQFPADVNSVVAVGGTSLSTNSSTLAWQGETAWFTPAGGGFAASGAGSGCSIFDTPQAWQTAANGWAATGCGSERGVADVSADADPNSGLWVWSTFAAGCSPSDNPGDTTKHCWFIVGGTSLASPLIAAVYGLASNPGTVANPGSLPYAHFRSLHDVTSGSTGSCGTTICRAAAGYDGPTGIGSPNGLLGFSIGTPAITSFNPTSGAAGAHVTINGTSFTQTSAVSFGGIPAQSFTVVSDIQINAVVGNGKTGSIAVTTPGGTTTASGFTAAPAVDSFTPNNGPAGTSVTITGSGFTGATAVKFGGHDAASFTVHSDLQITATVAAGTTTGPVTVTTPVGTTTTSALYYVPPTISGFTPGSGGVHSNVTLTGVNFTGASRVRVNGTDAAFAVVSNTTLTFTVPSGATTGTVQVTTPAGVATSAGSFTVSPPPSITSFDVTSGPVGTVVTITGTNLTGTVGVMLGSIIMVPTSVNATTVVFTIPPGAVTGHIRILNPAGSATSPGTFTVTG